MAFNLVIAKKESINKCIRFPVEIINKIQTITDKNNVSFSKFVIQACEYALDDLESQKAKKKTKN